MAFSYKAVFTHLYQGVDLYTPLADRIKISPDGRLNITLNAASPELVALNGPANTQIPPFIVPTSTLLFAGDDAPATAKTSDGRYTATVEVTHQFDRSEFWVIHTDTTTHKLKRLKLNTEIRANWPRLQPRIAVTAGDNYFLIDDSGTIRLYRTADLEDAGTFQIAHVGTENQVIALAISPDNTLIGGLSSWKDIVLYSIPERRVAFVRQIRDSVGWYDLSPAYTIITANADVIVTVGVVNQENGHGTVSVNAFRKFSFSA